MTELRAWLVDAATTGDWRGWMIFALLALLIGAFARAGFWRAAGLMVGVSLATVAGVAYLVDTGTVILA